MHTMRLEMEVGNQQETLPKSKLGKGSLGSPVQVTRQEVV